MNIAEAKEIIAQLQEKIDKLEEENVTLKDRLEQAYFDIELLEDELYGVEEHEVE